MACARLMYKVRKSPLCWPTKGAGVGGGLAKSRDTGQGQQQKGVIEDNTVTDKGATNRRIFLGERGGGLQKIKMQVRSSNKRGL